MSATAPVPEGEAQVPGPLDTASLARLLAQAGTRVSPGPDGALMGRWGEVVVRMTVSQGPSGVLNVVGLEPEPFPMALRTRLREAIEERHRHHPWPTCFLLEVHATREAPDGGLLLGGACALGTGAGVTHAQALRHVQASVVSFQEAFTDLRDALR